MNDSQKYKITLKVQTMLGLNVDGNIGEDARTFSAFTRLNPACSLIVHIFSMFYLKPDGLSFIFSVV